MTADFSWHRPYRAISQVAFSHFNWKKVFVFHFHRGKPWKKKKKKKYDDQYRCDDRYILTFL